MPTPQGRAQILNRLKSVDGHLRGVIKMIEDDAYCMDVIKQLQAVEGAIGRVSALLLEDHLRSCVTTAIRGEEPAERERVIGELLSLYEHGAALPAYAADPAQPALPAGTNGSGDTREASSTRVASGTSVASGTVAAGAPHGHHQS